MTAIAVRCERAGEGDWTCAVGLSERGQEVSAHRVRVRASDLARLAPDASDPTELVEASFGFLLERERPGSILRSFDLLEIGRYFPEFEATVRREHRPR